MIFAACLGIGFGKGQEYRRRIKELLVIKKMLLMLRGEIRYARTPLPEAFQNIGRKLDNDIGTFLQQAAGQMDLQKGESFAEIWEENLYKVLAKSPLTKEDKSQLNKLGSQLGYLDREMQVSAIEFQMEQLEGLVGQLEQEQGKKSRVCSCMGVFAGVMLNLILL